MTDLINTTGVPYKNKGDALSSSDINKINTTVNQCVGAINPMLKSVFNVNAETGLEDKQYTFDEAVRLVPTGRRTRGLKIKFLQSGDFFNEITFVGDSIEEVYWVDQNNWSNGGNMIDGGDW